MEVISDFKNYLEECIKKDVFVPFSKYRDRYDITFLDNEDLKNKHRKFGSDYRIDLPQFKDSSISFGLIDKKTGEVLFCFSIILYNPDNYAYLNFWRYDRGNNELNQINIDYLIHQNNIRNVLTFGYIKSSDAIDQIHKYEGILHLIKTIRHLLKLSGLLIFIECSGLTKFDNSIQQRNKIKLADFKDGINPGRIGETREESKAIETFCKMSGLKECPELFNITTLGKVFMNINLT